MAGCVDLGHQEQGTRCCLNGRVPTDSLPISKQTVSNPCVAPVAVEVVRSGFIECCHRADVVTFTPDGLLGPTLGSPHRVVMGRSVNKPLQAVAMLRSGLDLPDELLAVVCSSHSGEQRHLEAVGRILNRAGLGIHDLQNTPDLPLAEEARLAHLRAGGGPESILQNCSGKHAGMLATCVSAGWPTAHYLDVDHPLQMAITTTVGELCGEQVQAVGVDGCGAPQHAVALVGLARAFRTLSMAQEGTPEYRVARAMRTHPLLASGTRRPVARIMMAMPGTVAKDGAEGALAVGSVDGWSLAVKVTDGASRARLPLTMAAFDRLGLAVPEELADLWSEPVLGGGRTVGEVRAVWHDDSAGEDDQFKDGSVYDAEEDPGVGDPGDNRGD